MAAVMMTEVPFGSINLPSSCIKPLLLLQLHHNTPNSTRSSRSQLALNPSTMASMVAKTFILIILIFLIFSFPNPGAGGAHGLSLKEGSKVEEEPSPRGQAMVRRKVTRKILGMETVLMDYEEPVANPSHGPRRGSPGGRASSRP